MFGIFIRKYDLNEWNDCTFFLLDSVIGFPSTFQSGISSSLPSYTGQQSSIYGETSQSSSFTTPTTTVSTHSSSSAFHKPDDSSSSSSSAAAAASSGAIAAVASPAAPAAAAASSSSTSSPYGLHHEPSNYNSPSPFSVPTLSSQQQV